MSTLGKRVISGLTLAAVVLAVLFYLHEPAGELFFSACLLLGVWEWSGFLGRGPVIRVIYLFGGVLLAGMLFFAVQSGLSGYGVLIAALCWWLLLGAWLAWREIAYPRVLVAFAGYACLLPAWMALLYLLSASQGAWLMVWMIAIIAAADIGAYFTGKRFGRRKLAPQISPGKTVEGLAGGVLAATLVSVVGAYLLGAEPLWFALAGPLVALISVAGDLTVSAFKRNAGLKDTGWILPGHGGIMDRIDSLVAAAPVIVLLLSISGLLSV